MCNRQQGISAPDFLITQTQLEEANSEHHGSALPSELTHMLGKSLTILDHMTSYSDLDSLGYQEITRNPIDMKY